MPSEMSDSFTLVGRYAEAGGTCKTLRKGTIPTFF